MEHLATDAANDENLHGLKRNLDRLKKRNKKRVSKYTETASALRSHWASDGCRIVVKNPVMIFCLLYSRHPFWTSWYYSGGISILKMDKEQTLLYSSDSGSPGIEYTQNFHWSTIHLHQLMSCQRSLKVLMTKLQIKQNCLSTFTQSCLNTEEK